MFSMKKNKGKGEITENDAALWQHAMKHVKSYTGKSKKQAAPAEMKKAPPPQEKGQKTVTDRSLKTLRSAPLPKASPVPQGFDRTTETKLKKGKLPIEGKIDLHGMTQEEAHRALSRFITAALRAEKRTLLIITGKGKVGGGVLRRMLPLWLEEPAFRSHVLALTPSQPKDGGDGAFYLRLRKKREP